MNDLPPPLPGRGKLTTRMGLIQEVVETLGANRSVNVMTDETTAGVFQRPGAKAQQATSSSPSTIIPRWG